MKQEEKTLFEPYESLMEWTMVDFLRSTRYTRYWRDVLPSARQKYTLAL